MSSAQAFTRPSFQESATAPASPTRPAAGEFYKHSETTRLLCAAAYLDRKFRELVIKNCCDNRHQALGACFGLDMPTVVRHCRRAKRIFGKRTLFLFLPGLIAWIALFAFMGSPDGQAAALGWLTIVYFLCFGICLYFESRARAIVTHNFMRGNFEPEKSLSTNDISVDSIRAAEVGNTVIYSGFSPFVGSGENIGAWSFALDLRKRANPTPVSSGSGSNVSSELSAIELENITLETLYARVARDISAIGLDRVTLQDKLYVNGRDIRDDTRFLSHPLDRPRYRVDDQVVADAMFKQEEKQLRHYRCIRVVDWSGELVLSIFLRFSKLGHNLFVEASYFLLTPIAERFRAVDAMSPHFRFRRFVEFVFVTAIKTPFLTLWAPFGLMWQIFEGFQRWSARRHEDELIRENPTFDYGAAFSFRQWASSNAYRRYFQRLDKEMYLKVLEKNILDSILTFLEENDVDVSELKQRQTMILNQGVILSGGNMTTENLSVGVGAKVENISQKVTQFAGKASMPSKQSA
jgi:hypothetical protein